MRKKKIQNQSIFQKKLLYKNSALKFSFGSIEHALKKLNVTFDIIALAYYTDLNSFNILWLKSFKFMRHFFFLKKFVFFLKNSVKYYYNFYINIFDLKKLFFRSFDFYKNKFLHQLSFYDLYYFNNYKTLNTLYLLEKFNTNDFLNLSTCLTTPVEFIFNRRKFNFSNNPYFTDSLLFLPSSFEEYFFNPKSISHEYEDNLILKYNIPEINFLIPNQDLNIFLLTQTSVNLNCLSNGFSLEAYKNIVLILYINIFK